MKRLVIWGASGHGKVVLDVARAVGHWDEILFLDDAPSRVGTRVAGVEVIGRNQLPREFTEFIVAIGDNLTRAKCFQSMIEQGSKPATAIHPTAAVSPTASIGAGTVVMPCAVVNAGAVVGENCIINTGAIVEHDCVIDQHVHLSPGAVLGGAVKIGSYVHAGINASILPMVQIGESAVVGAGAVVLKSVLAGDTVVGVPAKSIRHFAKPKASASAS